MRQKLGIIQAILVDPQIIILDEPQTGLDPKARIEIRRIIRALQKQGKTIFLASHMLYEISEVCDKIALINHGKIIAFDTIDNLEKNLKEKELHCQLLHPISQENLEMTITNLTNRLKPYLNNQTGEKDSKKAIKYNSGNQSLRIYYDGKKESRGDILEILMAELTSNNKVISFSQPRTSKLEQIYLEMVGLDDEPRKNIKKEVK